VVGTNLALYIAYETGIFPALALDARATTGDLVEPKKLDSIAQFQKARPLYQQKGDTKTVADIDRFIQELSQ
jgi:hypothetical protein